MKKNMNVECGGNIHRKIIKDNSGCVKDNNFMMNELKVHLYNFGHYLTNKNKIIHSFKMKNLKVRLDRLRTFNVHHKNKVCRNLVVNLDNMNLQKRQWQQRQRQQIENEKQQRIYENSPSKSSSTIIRRFSSSSSSSSLNSDDYQNENNVLQKNIKNHPKHKMNSIISQRKLYIRLMRTTINISDTIIWSPTPPQLNNQIDRILNELVLPSSMTNAILQREILPTRNNNSNQGNRRRRHAVVPHKVTYYTAINRTTDQIEQICRIPFSLGPLNNMCRCCGALFFEKEPKNRQGVRLLCCKNGVIDLPQYGQCPSTLKNLYTDDGPLAIEFRNNIRTINSLFALASFKTSKPDTTTNQGQGHWCFTICGQIYHFIDGIPVNEQQLSNPKYSTYYFLDVDQALNKRNDFLDGRISRELLSNIERMLRQHHQYIIGYKTMFDIIREHQQQQQSSSNRRRNTSSTIITNNTNIENVIIGFTKDPIMKHQRKTHNLPEHGSDVAAVFYGDEPPFHVDLKVYPLRPDHPDARFRHQELKNLSPLSDCFVYPLLFPRGDIGYSIDYKHIDNRNKTVTFNEYYRYRLQIRDNFSTIHHGGKLFQQFVVDSWVKVETNRLWFYKQNQDRFRATNERNLRQIIGNNNIVDNDRRFIGKRYVLPAAFPGSPRNRHRIYLECMAIISRHGKPDFFITFTCNPTWKNISDNLKSHQKWEHRADLVCRTFHAYLLEFINDIVEKQMYGVVLNYFYVIEFQKRGLPHAHIVVTFRDENRFNEAESIDKVIHAYIPHKETQPNLYELVGRHQIHYPCGRLNPNATCMDATTGKCRKYFPKKYNNETRLYLGDNKRPLYKRPADGRTIFIQDQSGGRNVSNTRIIPYNPYALAKYQCHINFEAVGSIATIKYLHKYLNKGPDFVHLCEVSNKNTNATASAAAVPTASVAAETIHNNDDTINNDNGKQQNVVIDEINNYVECRYVSSMEAMWRILEYPMHDRSHSALTLPTHLPNERLIVFQEDDDADVLDRRLEKYTKLEAWFRLNQVDVDARQYRYVEIPEFYVWENKDSCWKKRKQISKQIGCLIDISAADNLEKYFLSILLKYRRGATSYESLRTLDDGTICETFKEACQRLNLLRHNDEFDKALQEASIQRLPGMLRRLFALICCVAIDENVAEMPYLWHKYKNYFIEDFIHQNMSRNRAIDIVIRILTKIISRNRSDIDLVALGVVNDEQQPPDNNNRNGGDNNDINDDYYTEEENRNEHFRQCQYNIESLNRDQKLIFYRVIKICSKHCDFLININDYKNLLGPNEIGGVVFENENDVVIDDDNDLMMDIPVDINNFLTLDDVALIDQQINENYQNHFNRDGYMYYLDGPGGTGKTYLYNTIINHLNETYRKSTIAVAWTGIAANLLINGQTVHRAFKLPLDITDTTIPGWPFEHPNSDNIRNSAIIIWDEAPMSSKKAVEAIDRYLRDITKKDIPMGGKILLFGGDFRQILPVVVGGGANAIIASSLKIWTYWPKINQLKLTQNMRAQNQNLLLELGNVKFSDWLLNMGNGNLPNVKITSVPDAPTDLIEIPKIFQVNSIDELLEFVYNNNYSDPCNGFKAILCPTNNNVSSINNKILELMSINNPVKNYISIDEYDHTEDDLYVPQELLNSIDVSSLPPHQLKLKVGCIVILLRNLDVEQGQCNGTRYLVTKLGDHFIEVESLQGEHRGQKLFLPKISMRAKSPILPREIKRLQFPVKLAYAMTINKSQGQTLHKVGIYLKKPCFTHGQLYVAFSRVSNCSDVKIFIENRNDQGSFKFRNKRTFTRNVIYSSILNEQHDEIIGRIQKLRIIYDQTDEEDEEVRVPDPVVTTNTITVSQNVVITKIVDNFLKSRVSVGDQPGTSGLN